MKQDNTFEPIGLLQYLESPTSLGIEWLPFINVLTLAFGIFLLSSHWLCPPGFTIKLPQTSSAVAWMSAQPMQKVLIVDNNSRIFFNKKLYSPETVNEIFDDFKETHILLKLDTRVSIELLTLIINNAYQHGCQNIQMAVNTCND